MPIVLWNPQKSISLQRLRKIKEIRRPTARTSISELHSKWVFNFSHSKHIEAYQRPKPEQTVRRRWRERPTRRERNSKPSKGKQNPECKMALRLGFSACKLWLLGSLEIRLYLYILHCIYMRMEIAANGEGGLTKGCCFLQRLFCLFCALSSWRGSRTDARAWWHCTSSKSNAMGPRVLLAFRYPSS